MIHHCKGLIAENENENIPARERDGLPLALEFQKRRSDHQSKAYPRHRIPRVVKLPLIQSLRLPESKIAKPLANFFSTAPVRPLPTRSSKFLGLQNHGCFLKIQPRITWIELGSVSVAQVAKQIHLPFPVGKECRIQFLCVETGHRSAI